MAKAYTVRYERDEDGVWVASVKEVPGCRTQGKSIGQARHRIREALGLYVDDADSARLVDEVRLDKQTRTLLGEVSEAKHRAERAQQRALETSRRAACELTKKLSVRDTGELLGVSHQRVQQLVDKRSEIAMVAKKFGLSDAAAVKKVVGRSGPNRAGARSKRSNVKR